MKFIGIFYFLKIDAEFLNSDPTLLSLSYYFYELNMKSVSSRKCLIIKITEKSTFWGVLIYI